VGIALAAGAMIFVVVEEVISKVVSYGHNDIATLDFTAMMMLDVALS
jgi:zinc transporter ZupT